MITFGYQSNKKYQSNLISPKYTLTLIIPLNDYFFKWLLGVNTDKKQFVSLKPLTTVLIAIFGLFTSIYIIWNHHCLICLKDHFCESLLPNISVYACTPPQKKKKELIYILFIQDLLEELQNKTKKN